MTGRRAALALLAIAIATGCGGAPARAPQPVPPPAPAAAVGRDAAVIDAPPPTSVARVAVIGASVSAGFSAPRIADAVASAGAGAVIDRADVWMFRDPPGRGATQVAEIRAAQPTLVLAVDFLFWFVYRDDTQAARLASLDDALALLATIEAPLAVGDVPDMRSADPRMISPAAIPPPEQLAEINARIRTWAAARPRTAVLPMQAWVAPLTAGGKVELAPGEIVAAAELVFIDGLHANALGLWYLLTRIDRALTIELGVADDALTFARP